jgi:hypothetical protein
MIEPELSAIARWQYDEVAGSAKKGFGDTGVIRWW